MVEGKHVDEMSREELEAKASELRPMIEAMLSPEEKELWDFCRNFPQFMCPKCNSTNLIGVSEHASLEIDELVALCPKCGMFECNRTDLQRG